MFTKFVFRAGEQEIVQGMISQLQVELMTEFHGAGINSQGGKDFSAERHYNGSDDIILEHLTKMCGVTSEINGDGLMKKRTITATHNTWVPKAEA